METCSWPVLKLYKVGRAEPFQYATELPASPLAVEMKPSPLTNSVKFWLPMVIPVGMSAQFMLGGAPQPIEGAGFRGFVLLQLESTMAKAASAPGIAQRTRILLNPPFQVGIPGTREAWGRESGNMRYSRSVPRNNCKKN